MKRQRTRHGLSSVCRAYLGEPGRERRAILLLIEEKASDAGDAPKPKRRRSKTKGR